MNNKAFWLAPLFFLLGCVALASTWAALTPAACVAFFDNDGCSPFELMTLPLFALVVPLVWLCPPATGSLKRKCFWNGMWSLLAIMALIREQDWHKAAFNAIWPDVAAGFRGTVFKMRFLTSGDVPVMPKVFVALFFALFFVAVLLPLIYYFVPLFKGFFKRQAVAWSMASFGISGVIVQICDRLPSNLRHAHHPLSESMVALAKTFEEGGEALLAIFALLAILQSYVINNLKQEGK